MTRFAHAIVFLCICGCCEYLIAGIVYWSDIGGTISRANLDGTFAQPLEIGGVTARDIALDLSLDKLYGTNMSGFDVARSNLDGTSFEPVVTGVGIAPWGIDLDLTNGLIYFTDRDADAIFRS